MARGAGDGSSVEADPVEGRGAAGGQATAPLKERACSPHSRGGGQATAMFREQAGSPHYPPEGQATAMFSEQAGSPHNRAGGASHSNVQRTSGLSTQPGRRHCIVVGGLGYARKGGRLLRLRQQAGYGDLLGSWVTSECGRRGESISKVGESQGVAEANQVS